MAPTYATLALGYLEEMLYHRISEKLGEEYLEFNKMERYLDDCFIIWSKEESNFNIVYNILNSVDPDIKFTMERKFFRNTLSQCFS